MERNTIQLQLDKNRKTLNGIYSLNLLNEQILPKLDFTKKNVIIFPENIENISIVFIMSLITKIPKELRKNHGFYEYFSIEGNMKLQKKFFDVVLLIYKT